MEQVPGGSVIQRIEALTKTAGWRQPPTDGRTEDQLTHGEAPRKGTMYCVPAVIRHKVHTRDQVTNDHRV